MPKVRLLAEGPHPYSDGVYRKGDVFYVGVGAAAAGVLRGEYEYLEDDPPPAPPDSRAPEQKIADLTRELAHARARIGELEGLLDEATA